MKKEYKKPMAKMIDYTYDEQIVAASSCDHGFSKGTSHNLNVKTREYCPFCTEEVLWYDSKA